MQDHTPIERLKEGDSEAIDEMVEEYKGPLFAFIMRMVNNHAVAEDIFQETWLRVIRHIKSFRGESKLSTWLFQIALNLCRNAERRKGRWLHVPIEEQNESLSYEPGLDAERVLKAQQVRKIVAELPSKMREVIVLRYFHDLSEQEIAHVVGCPVGTVKSRNRRASEIIRKKWESVNRIAIRGGDMYENIQ